MPMEQKKLLGGAEGYLQPGAELSSPMCTSSTRIEASLKSSEGAGTGLVLRSLCSCSFLWSSFSFPCSSGALPASLAGASPARGGWVWYRSHPRSRSSAPHTAALPSALAARPAPGLPCGPGCCWAPLPLGCSSCRGAEAAELERAERWEAPAADGRCRLSPRRRLLLFLSSFSLPAPLILLFCWFIPPRTSQPSRTPTFSCTPSPYSHRLQSQSSSC